ncbi:MAG: hypothetical protein NWF08_06040 [Candidatus Bathyarchaeota archaeon]|nr:hypothetical protein [Candidatus Bathyarchaeota archaeon]
MELAYWIGEELVNSGIAKFREEDILNMAKLSKIHWRETIPTSRQIPSLQKNFFFMLRRFLRRMNEESKTDSSKMLDYEKAMNLARDIVNCRVRKIISIAATSASASEMIENMAAEEIELYEILNSIINEWKNGLIKMEDNQ